MNALKQFYIFSLIILCIYNGCYAQNNLDIYPYSSAYKGFNSQTELDSINKFFQNKSLSVAEQKLNKIAFANAVDQLGNHEKALELLKSIGMNSSEIHPIILSEFNVAMGNIAIRSQNPELGLKHFKESVQLLENEKDIPLEIFQAKLMTLGTGFNAMEDNINAMKVFEQALLMETKGTNRNSLYLRLNIALTNSKLGELAKAKSYFTEALHIIRLNKDYYAETRTLGNLADIYFQQDSLELAQQCYEEGKKIALQEGYILDLIRYEISISNLYKKKGDFENAYNHLIASDSISNQYNSSSVSEQIVSLELQHQIQQEKLQKEAKTGLLAAEQNKKMLLIIFSSILFVVLVIIVWLLLVSNKKNKILLQQNLDSIQNKIKKADLEKNNYSEILDQLSIEMEQSKIYADSTLTLESLAKKLQTNRTYLSEAINNHYSLSFSQWINEKRIFHAKEMLFDTNFDAYSIEGISSLVGFSSISAFNSNFKKITGITPSYFRNNRSK